MPEIPTNSSRPVVNDTMPVHMYRELKRFVSACGGVEGAYEIAKLLKTMTIPISDLFDGIEAMRKQ